MLRHRVDAGAAGLLVTHEARHAAWADRVVFLRDGVIVDSTGSPDSPSPCSRAMARADGADDGCAAGAAPPGLVRPPP